MYYVGAGLTFLLLLLYIDRTTWLAVHGTTQTVWSLLARVGLAVLLFWVGVGFASRGRDHDPFLWFHWWIVVALIATCIGHVGMRGKAAT